MRPFNLEFMEEFKIVTLGGPEEKKEEQADFTIEKKDDYNPPRKRFIIIPLIILFVVVALVVINVITTYSDYDLENSWERKDAAESQYVPIKNNLLKYSTDGVFYTTYSGGLIWNYTYDMTNPSIDTCNNYIVIYDKKGNEIDVFSTSGFVTTIHTNTPIMDAQISNHGTVAALLQENNTSYLQMYDTMGTILAAGEIHPENSGYPVSIALSSNGTRLMVSIINLNEGNINSNVVFYDFSSAGKQEVDNIVASYSYLNMVIPKVDYLEGDKAVAFGDNEIILYNNNSKATVLKELFLSDQIKSVCYNDSYIGYVTEELNDEGEETNNLTIYNLFGFKCCSKEIDDSYEDIQIMSNDEVALISGEKLAIYNMQGFKKFSYSFDENIYCVIPGRTLHKYYLVTENSTDEIHLK